MYHNRVHYHSVQLSNKISHTSKELSSAMHSVGIGSGRGVLIEGLERSLFDDSVEVADRAWAVLGALPFGVS